MARVNLIAPDGQPVDAEDSAVPMLIEGGYKLDEPGPTAADASPALAEPASIVAAAPSKRVNLFSPDGQPVDAPAESVPMLVEYGYRLPSGEEARDAALQAEHGGFGSQLRTAAEGLASGVSLGVSDAVQAVGAGFGSVIGDRLEQAISGDYTDRRTQSMSGDAFDNASAAESSQAIDA